MEIRKVIFSCAALVGAMAWTASTSASAITVFADFNGDKSPDPSYTPQSTVFTATVYADVDDDFTKTYGGLISYGVRASNIPSTFLDITAIVSDAGWLLPETIVPTPPTDVVDVFDGTIGESRSGLVPLFDVTFMQKNRGDTTFSMQDVFPDKPVFDGFVTSSGFVADGSIIYLNTEISTIPIPSAIWLFGTGLVGLVGLARKRATV